MKYSDYRANIKSGDLLAWTSVTSHGLLRFVQNVIRTFTMSEYSHVGIAWVIGERVFVIEATTPLVRVYPLSNKPPFYHVDMDINWSDEHLTFLLARVGDHYSIKNAIQAYFGKPTEDREWECAELANAFYRNTGIDLGEAWTPSEVVKAALELSQALNPKSLNFVSKD